MNLVGVRIKHATFGTGCIIDKVGDYITVEFANKTVKFVYPDAFEKFLKAEDKNTQTEILSEIARIKEAQKKRTEELHKKTAMQSDTSANSMLKAKKAKAKKLEEMFLPDYHVEKLSKQPILTYQQVEKQFGIRIAGFGKGVNPTADKVVLVSSIHKASGKFVYHDKWTAEGDYLYSGEGRTGDQTMTKGNLAICNAALDGKEIHLFVKFSPQEYYYQGIFNLVNYTVEDDKDEDGNMRKEYKFRLRKTAINGSN